MNALKVGTKEWVTQVRGILSAAFEGGSNYWYADVDPGKIPDGFDFKDFHDNGKAQPKRPDGTRDYWHWCQLLPTTEGGSVTFKAPEYTPRKVYTLDLPALKKGWELVMRKYPHVWARLADPDDSGDAGDADVYLQLCVFGEVIFG